MRKRTQSLFFCQILCKYRTNQNQTQKIVFFTELYDEKWFNGSFYQKISQHEVEASLKVSLKIHQDINGVHKFSKNGFCGAASIFEKSVKITFVYKCNYDYV